MGILNVTPDSFADAAAAPRSGAAVDAALQMEADGADLIDIGGESTRPGRRAGARRRGAARACCRSSRRSPGALRVPISIDTYKADVAAAALDAGAAIVNDVSGLRYDPALARRRRRRAAPRSC